MTPHARYRIIVSSLQYTLFACCIVSATIMSLYERVDWPRELTIGNTLTIILTFSMTFFIGTKLEQITQLTDELRTLVERDRLTDIATRDFFFAQLESTPDAYGVSLMIDIDHFKRVNDTYGHLAGDSVIHAVAQIMRAQIREQDIVCRFGGEEFVIFLHKASPKVGWIIAERVRATVEHATLSTASGDLKVTVSVGGSLKDRIEDVHDAIKRADECLYRAKMAGRNRTVVDWPERGGAADCQGGDYHGGQSSDPTPTPAPPFAQSSDHIAK